MEKIRLSLPVDPSKWLQAGSEMASELTQAVAELSKTDEGDTENCSVFESDHNKLLSFVAAGWVDWTRHLTDSCTYEGVYTEDQKAWTGRLVSKPFHQGFPRPFRNAISKPGHVIVAADWRSAHLWIMGSLSEDDKLLDFLETTENPYKTLAQAINVTDEVGVKKVKTAMLAYLNGMGDTSLNQLAPGLVAKLDKSFKAASAWRKSLPDKGMVKKDGTPVVAHERIAGELQGTEAIAAYNVYKRLTEAGLEVINIIYDEVLLCIPASQVHNYVPLIKEVMAVALLEACETRRGAELTQKEMKQLRKNAVKLSPRLVKVSVGKTWGSVSEYTEDMVIEPEPQRPMTLRAWANEARSLMTQKEIDFSHHRNQWAFAALRMTDFQASHSWFTKRIEDASKADKRAITDFQEAVNHLADMYLIKQGEMLPSNSEQSLAAWIYDRQHGNLKADANHFYVYDGLKSVWKKDENGTLVYGLITKLNQKPVRGDKKLFDLSASRLDGITRLLSLHTQQNNPWKEARSGLLIIEDAAYEVGKGWTTLTREDCVLDSQVLHYKLSDVQTAGEPHQWLGFLKSVWDQAEDFQDRIAFLQEFLGACMAGIAPQYEQALMCIGEGKNGKSTMMKVVMDSLFTKGLVSAVDLEGVTTLTGRLNLIGKRINVIADMNSADLRDTGVIKQIISGEPVTAKQLYKDEIVFSPQAGFLIGCNNVPRTTDHSTGFWRRWRFINFPLNLKEDEGDVGLAGKLHAERTAIFAWALKGLERLLVQGRYTKNASSTELNKELSEVNDQTLQFVKARIESSESSWVSAQKLFDAYTEWSKRTGHGTKSMTNFGLEIKRHVKSKKSNRGTIYGVVIRPMDE